MYKTIKQTASSFLPERLKQLLIGIRYLPTLLSAKSKFRRSSTEPAFLGDQELKKYQDIYPKYPPYSYDFESLRSRGVDRAGFLMKSVMKGRKQQKTLEVGAGDGMVSWELLRNGHHAFAIDQSSDMFSELAKDDGVVFKAMDAADLQFEDDSFDFLFSYNSFEHFHDPDKVLDEMCRVLKPGGYMYHVFEPINSSAFGYHAYRSINVPFCQYLFPREVMNAFCESNNLPPINYEQLNLWTTTQYRELWRKYESKLEFIKYNETKSYTNLDLICRHPSCFKSKTRNFDDLYVSGMELILKKRVDPHR